MQPTKKLYYEDPHQKDFTATVTACKPFADGWRIALDQTAFFPEGGGQSGDAGFLNEIPVYDAQEKDDVVWHYTKAPLPPGASVMGRLDWGTRFSRMQQHSGEHIVSGLVHRRFGYDNVGFHLGEREVTLDFNGSISKEDLAEIEVEANQIVFANLPVLISYPAKDELASLDYRSKIEILGQVRIVTIPGVDICACCAPHVSFTGEIGLIKLTNVQVHRGGVRVSLLAGDRALCDYQEKERSIRAISVLLSVKESRTAEAVEHLKQENYVLTGQLMQLMADRVQEKASGIPEGTRDIVFFENGLDTASMREFVNLLTVRCTGIACVFNGTDENGYRYVCGSTAVDVRPLCKKLNAAFSGKGGGKPEMVQGSLTGTEQAIRRFLEADLAKA